jgi:hypothetical protein
MNDSTGDLVLDQKEEGVKLDKDTIIICEAMEKKEIFRCMRDM